MTDEQVVDLEIKLAYQDKRLGELDALVRALGTRLDQTERDLAALKQTVSSPEVPLGSAGEKPPHY
jgi:uncharacterized coiled-coil protein SlyX